MSNLNHFADTLMKAALNAGAEQAEVTLNDTHVGVARFKDKAIHQNLEGFRPIGPPYTPFAAKLRVIKDGLLGVATNSRLDPDVLVEDALKSAKYGSVFESFPEPAKAHALSGLYYPDTASLAPEVRIEAVNRIVDACRDYYEGIYFVGGYLSNISSTTLLANSLGLDAEHTFTGAEVIVTALVKENNCEGSGYQRSTSRSFYDLDLEKVAMDAAESAISTTGYQNLPVPVGKTEVLFEAEAAAEYLGTLTQMAFSVNRRPLCTTRAPLGELVLDEKLTIHDNGRDRRTLQASAIDGEGVPKRSLCLVNNGVPENRCYNTAQAKSEGLASTGHASAPWSGYFWTGTGNGSTYTPTNQIIAPGDSSLEDLISDTKDGILVRRLRCPAANGQTIMPDIIRADTQECWTIKNGEVVGPANYIRFTDSLVDSLKHIELGDASTVKAIGSFLTPAVKINSLYISQPSVVMVQ